MKRIVIAIAFAFQILFCHAQQQLTTLKSSNLPANSFPSKYIVLGTEMFFTADGGATGRELWKTDGTGQGTSLVKDINIGRASSSIDNFVIYKGKLYFVANDNVYGQQIWATDGTGQGTVRVTNTIGEGVYNMVSDANFIYYLKNTRAGLGLWRTDGTAAGSKLVKGDITIWNSPTNMKIAGGLIYFSCQPPGTNNTRVWRSDGTEAGTFPITTELDGDGSDPGGTSHPTQFVEYNNNLFFIARGKTYPQRVGLLKSNGTVAGTVPVVGFHDGSRLVSFGDVLVHNNKMYFTFFEADYNHFFILESDGTAGNTVRIFDESYPMYFSPSRVLADGDYLYFSVGNAVGGTSLAQLNLKTGTTDVITEIAPPVENPFIFIQELAVNRIGKANNSIFVQSQKDGWGDSEVVVVTPANKSTTLLSGSRTSSSMVSFNNRIYYSGASGYGFELTTSDGTLSGTSVLKDINTSGNLPVETILYGNGSKAMFAGTDPEHGVELWGTDGTHDGTTLLRDFVPGEFSSYPQNFVIHDGLFFFSAQDKDGIRQLYSSDGTAQRTKAVTSFTDGRSIYLTCNGADGNFFFVTSNANYTTYSLYVTDGTTAGTKELRNFGTNGVGSPYRASKMVLAGRNLYFILTGEGSDLWKSDGTGEGTMKVSDLQQVDEIIAVGNRVYLTNEPEYLGEKELYTSDGTPDGTHLVKDLNGTKSADITRLTAFGDKVVFASTDDNIGREVWISDGTEAGTTPLKDIFPGSGSGVYQPQFAVLGNQIYFAANDGTHGMELWKSDGTSANTNLMKDIATGSEHSSPNSFTVAGNTLHFSAYTVAAGCELWTVDGTTLKVELLADTNPGPSHSNPAGFVKLNDALVFVAEGSSDGRQVWSYGNSVNSIEEEVAKFSIYPNPSTGLFQIQLPDGHADSIKVEVINLQGKTVYTASLKPDESINLVDKPVGLYVLKISTRTKAYASKLVKQ